MHNIPSPFGLKSPFGSRKAKAVSLAVNTVAPSIQGNLAATTLHIADVGAWTGAVAFRYVWTLAGEILTFNDTARPPNGGTMTLAVSAQDVNGVWSAYVSAPSVTVADWIFDGMSVLFGPEPDASLPVTMSGPLVTGIVGELGKTGPYDVTNVTTGEKTRLVVPTDTTLPFDVTPYGVETDIIDVQYEVIGPASPTLTRPDAPEIITDLAVTPGIEQNSLTWTAPASASSITDYKIYAKSGGGAYTLLTDGVSTTPSYVHTGLTTITDYTYYVVAVSIDGDGAPSNEVVGRPQAPAAAITIEEFDGPASQSGTTPRSFTFTGSATGRGYISVVTYDAVALRQINGVTVNGVTATFVADRIGGNINTRWYRADNLVSGTNTVDVTTAGSSANTRWAVRCWRVENDDAASAAEFGSSNSATNSRSATFSTGDGAVALAQVATAGSFTDVEFTNATERAAFSVWASELGRLQGDVLFPTAQGSYTITATGTGTAARINLSVLRINAAS